jgi:peroxiredoxin
MAKLEVPQVVFKTRVRDESIGGDNPYRWQDMTTDDYFKDKRVVVFSLPGAFTPTCSTYQVPTYNQKFDEFKALGIDAVYCISVNDAFVMNKWAQAQEADNITFIPDGNGEFTRKMGYLVEKKNLGFGERSWRYSMLVNDGQIVALFEEPGFEDNVEGDPYEVSDPDTMLNYLIKNTFWKREKG